MCYYLKYYIKVAGEVEHLASIKVTCKQYLAFSPIRHEKDYIIAQYLLKYKDYFI